MVVSPTPIRTDDLIKIIEPAPTQGMPECPITPAAVKILVREGHIWRGFSIYLLPGT